MPAVLLTMLRFVTPSKGTIAFLRTYWPLIGMVVLVVIAGCMVHRAGVRAAREEAAIVQAVQARKDAEARAAAEVIRQEKSKVVEQVTADTRKQVAVEQAETQKREDADQARHDRNVVAITGAKKDSMVEEGGPLDRMFSGGRK